MTALPPWVYTFVIVTVTVVWAGLNVIDPLTTSYEVPTYVQAIMGIAAGAALGGRIKAVQRNGGAE